MPIYSYAELKGKIKVGDKVKPDDCTHPVKVTDVFIVGFKTDDGGVYVWTDGGTVELLTEEKTLDTVDVGDVVVSDVSDYEHTIIDTTNTGAILFLSRANDPTGYSFALARRDLKDLGYTVKQSTPVPEPKEMTLEEVSKALGYSVRIKE